ncbi:MAG TPA: hypothetical protein VHU60_03205 [Gaiellaceae bacterium]|nr:hypothetical protein [Gaiellaceae bacterium]
MSDVAVRPSALPVQLDANAVLKQAWSLYKRLFGRSVLLGALVLGAMHLVEALAQAGQSTAGLLLALVLAIAGIALLQGGLVEIVRGLHHDGDDETSIGDVLAQSMARLGKLVAVSLLTALGVAFGFALLLVPGLLLMTRWALAVPVAMLEDGNARQALARSRELVRGNGWSIFKILFAAGVLTGLVQIPFTVAAVGAGPFGWWLAATAASALTAPYAAHALTVAYYTLVDPGSPVVLEPGRRWQSIWQDEDTESGEADAEDNHVRRAWAQYEARFAEQERRLRGED